MKEPVRHPGELVETGDRAARQLYNFRRRYEDYKGKVIRSMNRYCACGHPLWIRETWDGTDWERICYESDQAREVLTNCPSCRADLNEVVLKNSPPRAAT